MTAPRPKTIAKESKRFWSKVDRSGGPTACWPWIAGTDKQGRGRFTLAGAETMVLAHRFAWEEKRGAIPDGNRCRQDCGNFLCCNDAHMSLDCPFARLTVYNATPGTFLADAREFLGFLASQNYADLTVETYGLTLEEFNRFLAKDFPAVHSVADLTRQHTRAYSLQIYEATTADGGHITHQTRSKKLHAVRSFLRYFATETDTEVLAYQKVTTPRQQRGVDRVPRTVATPEQVRALMDACSDETVVGRRNRAILALLFSAGLRISELCDLDRASVPLAALGKDPTFKITVIGKGGHARLCFVDAQTQRIVRTMLEDRQADADPALFIHYRPGARINARHRGTHRLSPRAVQVTMVALATTAGLPAGITPHCLRHGFAVDMLKGGVDIRTVQSLMGHASLMTTQVYTRLEDSYLAEGYARRKSLQGAPGKEASA